MRIQNFIFDLYGTLIDIKTDEQDLTLYKAFADYLAFVGGELQPEKLRSMYFDLVEREKVRVQTESNPYTGRAADFIDIDIIAVFEKLLQLSGAARHDAQDAAYMFRKLSVRKLIIFDGAIRMLKELKSAGRGVYLLSNAQRAFTVNELKDTALTDCFDGIMLSSDYKMAKPDPAFFELLLNKFNLDAKNSMMIGNDKLDDIAGARAAGLKTFYIKKGKNKKCFEKLIKMSVH